MDVKHASHENEEKLQLKSNSVSKHINNTESQINDDNEFSLNDSNCDQEHHSDLSYPTTNSDEQSCPPLSNSDEQSCPPLSNSDEQSCPPLSNSDEQSCPPLSNSDNQPLLQTQNNDAQSYLQESISDADSSIQTSLEKCEEPRTIVSNSSVCHSEMSDSLCTLLSFIDNKNSNGLNHQSDYESEEMETEVSKYDKTVVDLDESFTESKETNKFTLSTSKEDLNKKDIGANGASNILYDYLSDSVSPPSKRTKFDNIDGTDGNGILIQSAVSVTELEQTSNGINLKNIKKEVDDHMETDWTKVIIKSEDNSITENDELEHNMEQQSNLNTSDSNESNVKVEVYPLPSYLEHFVKIKPPVIVTKLRCLPSGKKVKVRAIKFHSLVNMWCFKETFLSYYDRCMTLRRRLDLVGTQFIYAKSMISDLHPVDIGAQFPFSCPGKVNIKKGSEPCNNLVPPLATLVCKKPDIASTRQVSIAGNVKQISTVNLAQEMVDFAFKESLLSKLSDAPNTTSMLNVDFTWPECSFEALDAIEVDCKFPFAFSKGEKEKVFFSPLQVSLPSSFFEEGQNLPSVPQYLKKKFDMAKGYLIKLLAAATYYIYSAMLAEIDGQVEKQLMYNSIVCSLRPLVTSQANEFGTVIVEIRQNVLSEFTCAEKNIIPLLINGPIYLWSSFFAGVKTVEKNMKINNIVLEKRK